MNAIKVFESVVKRNYEQFVDDPDDLRLLWNAVVSMNTVAEYVALDRLGYAQVARKHLDRKAKEVRDKSPILLHLKVCAETLKHVRKLRRNVSTAALTTIPSASSLLANQPSTWVIQYQSKRYVLSDILSQAFAAVSVFPEFKRPKQGSLNLISRPVKPPPLRKRPEKQ
jgi:hypothetical protein